MKDSVASALEIHGITADSIVAEDGMIIIIGPKEKRTDAKSTHGGFAGKSLIEKIRNDLDEVFKEYKEGIEGKQFTDDGEDLNIDSLEKLAEGIAHALGVLRGTNADEEWKMAEYRYAQNL